MVARVGPEILGHRSGKLDQGGSGRVGTIKGPWGGRESVIDQQNVEIKTFKQSRKMSQN